MFLQNYKNKSLNNALSFMLSAVFFLNVVFVSFFGDYSILQNNSAQQAVFESDGNIVQASILLNYSKIENNFLSHTDNLSQLSKILNKNSNLVYKLINTAVIKNSDESVKFKIFLTSYFSTST